MEKIWTGTNIFVIIFINYIENYVEEIYIR